jgi:hypothetical protein
VPDSEDTMFADEETGWYSSAIHALYLSPCSYIYTRKQYTYDHGHQWCHVMK